MLLRRSAMIALVALFGFSVAAPQSADAQGYGGGRLPLMNASQWYETEDGGWNGTWTFTGGGRPRTMSAVWTNNQTGRHRRANNMTVTRRGEQIIISRPGLGNYVGTISSDGRSLEGTLSWSSGRFSARVAR